MALAMRGRGAVEPNPTVGCVIVQGGKLIGEGYHQRFGGPHAEPMALEACEQSPRGATAFVSLEPCCHADKQTPPCVPRLIEAGVARVVIGTVDPNPQVCGRGVEQLRRAGIAVDNLDLPEARQLIAPFIACIVHGRPYVTLKWAESADRKVAGPMGRRAQISGEKALRAVHQLRSRCDAILVGINTVLSDNPMLTSRLATPLRPLRRIVLDSKLRMPTDCRLARTATEGKVTVYTSRSSRERDVQKGQALEDTGVGVRGVTEDQAGRLSLREVLDDIAGLGTTHLLVEPGPTLAKSWLATPDLWDRLWVIASPARIDDPAAPAAPALPDGQVAQYIIEPDRLTEYLNPRSPLTFSAEPSADLVMTSGALDRCTDAR